MNINRVTITGADDSVRPEELLALSFEFPFVEWAILLGKKEGSSRFPSRVWIDELASLVKSYDNIQLAGHICGAWVRNLVVDKNDEVFLQRPEFTEYFPRIQLNFSPYNADQSFLDILKPFSNEFIFQLGDIGIMDKVALLNLGRDLGLNLSILFDRSGGKGVVPLDWPEPIDPFCVGYAGGLGPDTLSDQLSKISEIVGDRTIWIDMESKVRSEDDHFDLKKVRECLEISSRWTK